VGVLDGWTVDGIEMLLGGSYHKINVKRDALASCRLKKNFSERERVAMVPMHSFSSRPFHCQMPSPTRPWARFRRLSTTTASLNLTFIGDPCCVPNPRLREPEAIISSDRKETDPRSPSLAHGRRVPRSPRHRRAVGRQRGPPRNLALCTVCVSHKILYSSSDGACCVITNHDDNTTHRIAAASTFPRRHPVANGQARSVAGSRGTSYPLADTASVGTFRLTVAFPTLSHLLCVSYV